MRNLGWASVLKVSQLFFPFWELKASEQFNSFFEIEQQIKIKHGLIV